MRISRFFLAFVLFISEIRTLYEKKNVSRHNDDYDYDAIKSETISIIPLIPVIIVMNIFPSSRRRPKAKFWKWRYYLFLGSFNV